MAASAATVARVVAAFARRPDARHREIAEELGLSQCHVSAARAVAGLPWRPRAAPERSPEWRERQRNLIARLNSDPDFKARQAQARVVRHVLWRSLKTEQERDLFRALRAKRISFAEIERLIADHRRRGKT